MLNAPPARLRKELFAFTDNKIAVQFWYEYYDEAQKSWFRCYGLGKLSFPIDHTHSPLTATRYYAEDWTFAADGRMAKRQMSGNDVQITEAERWYKDGVDVDKVEITSEHW